ncbi:MAG: NAD-dependent epimerase/dehydratase family protein [Candidatus Binatia bacterium]
MKAFVTGGTGFLGGRVVAGLLERGAEVIALVRHGSDGSALEAAGVELVRGELGELEPPFSAVESCDVVFHCGARVETGGAWPCFHKTNVLGTKQLMELAFRAGVSRFVHVSSLGIFGVSSNNLTIKPDSNYDEKPFLRGHYTRSKLHADRVACAAARNGKPVVIVRPGVLYGPGRPLFMGRVHKQLGSRLLVVIGGASYPVPICFVDNAAAAIIKAGSVKGIDGRMFNVIDDPGLRQDRYFRVLGTLRERSPVVVYVPAALISPVLRLVESFMRVLKRRDWSVAHQLRRSLRSAYYLNDEAVSALGWNPEVDLEEGLQRSLSPDL